MLLHLNAHVLQVRGTSSCLQDRTDKVKILSNTFREISIKYGVPQMSPRSSLLFLICKSDLPPLQPNTGRSLFADDLMFYTEDTINTSAYIRSNLQSCLNNFVDFSVDHRLILSCSKSVSTLFEKKRSGALASKDHRLFPPFLPPSL